ncbi:hypothetical protein [Marinobacter sp. X15-166B]|uniref:hypothetical protein n=1 Tax=Marinobacter sp. X15-166B TaxID=1897620 RepID=UPI00085C8334|nr:hypothetical protein [Marinobacter sp. X15-166B]OEY65318.1 hypothetical protein BG841_01795 [Marinobacter sp. X15-166B]
MPTDTLLKLVSVPFLPVLLGGVILLLVLVLALAQRKHWQHNQSAHAALQARVEVLRKEMDEHLVEQFNDAAPGGGIESKLVAAQQATEKTAYEALWPQVWSLHEKLGSFLRAVESGDTAAESRVAARNAALDARHTLNRVRPFCHSRVDALATQLIDTDIKAHLTGCQYLDLAKEGSSSGNLDEPDQLRQKFRMLYDVDARELLNQLVDTIRRRMVRHPLD